MSDNMLSMTGYGEATQKFNDREWRCVVQSVNSRYFDCRCRLPHNFQSIESRFKELAKKFIERGKVDVVVTYEACDARGSDSPSLSNYFNVPWVTGFCHSSVELVDSLGWPLTENLYSTLLSSAFTRREAFDSPSENIDEVAAPILLLLRSALELHHESRKKEGSHLAADFRRRIYFLVNKMTEIEGSASVMPQVFKKRIELRLVSIIDDNRITLDESRLCQEIAYLIDKADISEEIVRFKSHIAQFLDEVESETTNRKGKKLEFIIQEILREINTIGSKANLLEITRNVVDIKNELEKIREQVQNVI